MAVFRIQEHTPDVYPRKSRDFQLLCNVFDCVNNGVKYDIDSIIDILDTQQCNESLLPLLQTKLGFFTNKNITNDDLRLILVGFSKIVKDKGSRIGIQSAIEVFLKIINASKDSRVIITNRDGSNDSYNINERLVNTYVVEIGIKGDFIDVSILTELLRYVLPAGYRLKYSFYEPYQNITEISNSDTIHIVFIKKSDNDGIKTGNNENEVLSIHGVSTTTTVPYGKSYKLNAEEREELDINSSEGSGEINE